MCKLLKDREDLINLLKIAYPENYSPIINKQIINPIIEDKNNFFVALADEVGKITYARRPEDKLVEKKRIKTSIRRFIRRQLNIPSRIINDYELDRFGSRIFSFLPESVSNNILVLKGQDIVDFYQNTKIKTCMTGREHSLKLELYKNNPDKVSLVVLDGYVRAFVWTTDDNKKLLDRIYPADNWDVVEKFLFWAKNQGFILRKSPVNVIGIPFNVDFEDNSKHIITMKDASLYPYLDSFRYGQIRKDVLQLSNYSDFGEIILIATDGTYKVLKTCDECGKRDIRHSIINNRVLCHYCGEKFKTCRKCRTVYNARNMNDSQRYLISYYGYYYCESCANYVRNDIW